MNRGLLFGLLVLLCIVVCVHSDIYMHVPRGSNNRLIDANEYTNNDQRERDNDKRLFNSQNNDRGGYPAPAHTLNGTGEMYYYERSILSIEWTAQHSCLNPTTSCDFIIQYMCDNNGLVRDGAVQVAYTVDPTNGVLIPTPRADTLATGANNAGFDFTMLHEFQVNSGTIPVTSEEVKGNTAKCVDHNCDSDPKYGRHESLDYWLRCTNTKRNMGLFTADQNLYNQGNNNNNAKVNSAGRTRQNANGDRHGYECAEERDYYPYWNPSPWKDIAILTNDVSRCAAWQDQTQNVRGRYICVYQPSQALTDHLWNINTAAGTGTNNFGWIPTTQADCEASVNPTYAALGRGVWTLVPAFGIAPPKCIQHAAPTRDNSLGNAVGGYPYNFNWTIPSDYGENCVLRIRYNITSAELSVDPSNNYQLTGTDELHGRFAGYNSATDVQSLIDYRHNSAPSANQPANTFPTNLQIWRLYGLSDSEHPLSQYPPNNNVQGTIRADASGQYYAFTRGYYFEGNPHVDIFGDLLMNGNGLTDGFSSAGCAANTNPNGVADTNYPLAGPCWQLRRSITNNVYTADGTTGRNANDWDNNGNSRNTAFVTLRLSFNTNQFSRTFQDRSYTFSIRPRPPALQKYNIYNLNVKGKRGNIVQTYPSTEYDFHPNHLMLNKGDLIHIQWGGSDYTDRNNAGQGTGGIDRSNIVMLRSSRDMDPVFNKYGQATGADSNGLTTYGSWATNYPGWIDDQTKYPFLGLDFIDLNRLAFNGLNYSYFDLGPRQVTKAGIYHYMSSRNNQFTNRSQKGKIVVLNTVAPNTPMDGSGQPAALQWSALMAYQGGSNSAGAYLSVGDLNGYDDISQVPEALTTQDPWIQSLPTSGYDTQWVVLNPPMIEITQKCTEKYGGLWLVIPIPLKPLHNAVVYYKTNATSSDLMSIDGVTSSSTSVSVPIGGNAGQQGGYYTVKLEPNQGAIAGIVIGAVAFICIASFIVWKVKIQPAGGFQAWLRAQKIGKGTKTAAEESDSVALVNGQTNNAV